MTDDAAAGETIHPNIDFGAFLSTVPPNSWRSVQGMLDQDQERQVIVRLEYSSTELLCESDKCGGLRIFRPAVLDLKLLVSKPLLVGESANIFIAYKCSNCQTSRKVFALHIEVPRSKPSAVNIFKFGELPPFGPDTPGRVLKLIGPDRDAYLKGRRCESQGLGVGAFAYYRRVVENQKGRLFEQLITAATRLSAPEDVIQSLRSAQQQVSFSRGMDEIKLPQSLLIKSHNPMTLLHNALSEGLHIQSDEQCLERARDVRLILTALSERLEQALRDEHDLDGAVKRLLDGDRRR